jgi:hypothetical protein
MSFIHSDALGIISLNVLLARLGSHRWCLLGEIQKFFLDTPPPEKNPIFFIEI